MQIAPGESRHTFAIWLRTGRRSAAGIERKFNPNHDPRDGRFTFGPGGAGSSIRTDDPGLGRVMAAGGRSSPSPTAFSSFLRGRPLRNSTDVSDRAANLLNDGVFRPDGDSDLLQQAQYRPVPPEGIGSNSRAFQDPMTLEQAFPGLHGTPGGLMLPLADNVFNLTGPANELTSSMSLEYSRKLIDQIKTVDPSYVHPSFGFPDTLDGQMREIGDLRLDRAATFYRMRGETAPLQVETLRFVQNSTDRAYDAGVQKYERGELDVHLSREEAIGNFVDRQVRQDLRELYSQQGISTTRDQQVRVNGREYDTSGTDSTYRTPDARVGKVAYDWTLTRKTAGIAQVRGYFNSDLKPDAVIIVRPSQLGRQSTYAITRPRN